MASAAVPGAKLFVGCLPYSKTEADLEPLFSQYGPIQEVAILTKPDGSSKGAAFVTYQSPHHARLAMTALQHYEFPGCPRQINISMAGAGGGAGGGGAGCGGGAGGKGCGGKGQAGPPMAAMGGGPGCKVFVGQLPYSKSENDLLQLFSSIGPVAEVTLLKDKTTQEKKGAAFVNFASPHSAQAAVRALDGFTFNGSSRPIAVSLAAKDNGADFNAMGAKRGFNGQGPAAHSAVMHQMGQVSPTAFQFGSFPQPTSAPVSGPEGSKIFVGQLPFSQSETSIAQAFSKFGPVHEVFLHKDAQGQKKGACFVRYYDADHATQALSMNGYIFDGATRPITVQLASEAKRRRVD